MLLNFDYSNLDYWALVAYIIKISALNFYDTPITDQTLSFLDFVPVDTLTHLKKSYPSK